MTDNKNITKFVDEYSDSSIVPSNDEPIAEKESHDEEWDKYFDDYVDEFYEYVEKEVDFRIPTYFYFAMASELGEDTFEDKYRFVHDADGNIERDENGKYIKAMDYGNFGSSTGGWSAAFYRTCDKLGMQWLVDYLKTLDWYCLELFDGIIEERIAAMCEALDTEIGKL